MSQRKLLFGREPTLQERCHTRKARPRPLVPGTGLARQGPRAIAFCPSPRWLFRDFAGRRYHTRPASTAPGTRQVPPWPQYIGDSRCLSHTALGTIAVHYIRRRRLTCWTTLAFRTNFPHSLTTSFVGELSSKRRGENTLATATAASPR